MSKYPFIFTQIFVILIYLLIPSSFFETMDSKFLFYFQNKKFDEHKSLKAQQNDKESVPFVLIEIDDYSIEKLGWPIPRNIMATLIILANFSESKSIAFDILFFNKGPVEDWDNLLKKAIKDTKIPVILGAELLGTSWNLLRENVSQNLRNSVFYDTSNKNSRTGYVNLIINKEGIPWFIQHFDKNKKSQSISHEMAASLTKIKKPIDNKPKLIPFLLKDNNFPKISLIQLLADFNDPIKNKEITELLKGKALLVAYTSLSAADLTGSPFGNQWPAAMNHLNAAYGLNQGIDANVKIGKNYLALIASLILIVIAWSIPVFYSTLTFMVLTLGIYFFNLISFNSSWSFYNLSSFLFLLPFSYFLQVLFDGLIKQKKNRLLKEAFNSYVDEGLLEKILKDPESLNLGGHSKEITVLFSDIRDFTSNSEILSPEEVMEMLNAYFSRSIVNIFKNKGTIRHFIGDAVMVIYSFPVNDEDHAYNALLTADAMLKEAESFKEWVEKRFYNKYGMKPFNIGIGIHSGEVILGNIGSEKRMEFTAIGDTVNSSSRLEGLTKNMASKAAISRETLIHATKADAKIQNTDLIEIAQKKGIKLGEFKSHKVKGREKPLIVFEFFGINGESDIKE